MPPTTFRNLDLRYVLDAESLGQGRRRAVPRSGARPRRAPAATPGSPAQASLGSRIGASVYLVGDFNVDGVGQAAGAADRPRRAHRRDRLRRRRRRLPDRGRSVPSFGVDRRHRVRPGGDPGQRSATAPSSACSRSASRSTRSRGAVNAIRTAFLYAALAGLALTLILAHPALRHGRPAPAAAAPGGARAGPARARGARCRSIGRATRSATSRGRSRSCSASSSSRRRRAARSSPPPRTSCARRSPRSTGCSSCSTRTSGAVRPTSTTRISLLERSRAQSRRLARLAADLLDLSRHRRPGAAALRAGRARRAQPGGAGRVRAGACERRASSPSSTTPSGPVWALGDPGSVARIVRILLDNAIRLSPAGAEIKVELPTAMPASLSVCDQRPRRRARGARADLQPLPARVGQRRGRPDSGSGWRSAASSPRGWAGSWCSTRPTARERSSRCGCPSRTPPGRARGGRLGVARAPRRTPTDSITAHGRASDEDDARRRRAPLVVPGAPPDHPRRARPAGAAGRRAVLDAGCGSGRTLQELTDYGPVHGIELDPGAADVAALARASARSGSAGSRSCPGPTVRST